MPFKAPLESLIDGWCDSPVGGFVTNSIEHIIEFFKHSCRIFRDLVYAIDGLVGMDGVRGLESDAGLFEGQRKERDSFRDAVDFETFAGNFATDSIQNERQPEACTCDANYGGDQT